MALLVTSSLTTGEIDMELMFEYLEDENGILNERPILMLRKSADKDIDLSERIYLIEEANFRDLLVHTRSRDWTGAREGKNENDGVESRVHARAVNGRFFQIRSVVSEVYAPLNSPKHAFHRCHPALVQ